jgi:hypothetical protein
MQTGPESLLSSWTHKGSHMRAAELLLGRILIALSIANSAAALLSKNSGSFKGILGNASDETEIGGQTAH